MFLQDNSYTREQELRNAENTLLGIRKGIRLLTNKTNILFNSVLFGEQLSIDEIQFRVKKLIKKNDNLKSRIPAEVERVLFISSFRHTAIGEDVNFVNSLEKTYLLDDNYEKLLGIRLISIHENYIDIAGVKHERFVINKDNGQKVFNLGYSLKLRT